MTSQRTSWFNRQNSLAGASRGVGLTLSLIKPRQPEPGLRIPGAKATACSRCFWAFAKLCPALATHAPRFLWAYGLPGANSTALDKLPRLQQACSSCSVQRQSLPTSPHFSAVVRWRGEGMPRRAEIAAVAQTRSQQE